MIKLQSYHINFDNLRQWLLPHLLRQPTTLAWLKAFTAPLELLHTKKQLWRDSIRYKLQHNGQVIYLEKVLNEYYNVAGYDHQNHQATKQIYIGDGEQIFPPYIYTENEQQPVPLYTEAENQPLYTYTQGELEAQYANFIVWVPVGLTYIEAEMRALIDYYINTRFFKIKTY